MSNPWDWRLNEIESNARKGAEAHGRMYEIDTLRSHVDRLECAMREAGATIDGLRAELETLRGEIAEIKERQ